MILRNFEIVLRRGIARRFIEDFRLILSQILGNFSSLTLLRLFMLLLKKVDQFMERSNIAIPQIVVHHLNARFECSSVDRRCHDVTKVLI